MSRRAQVFGADIGGLAAAARLRTQGFDVSVITTPTSGGAGLSSYSRDGLHFDLGPTTLTVPAAFRDLFLKTGAALEECVELLPVDGKTFFFADNRRVSTPGVGVAAFGAAVASSFGARTGDEWRDYTSDTARMWSAIRQDVLHRPLATPGQYLRTLKTSKTLRDISPWSSLRTYIRRQLDHQDLRRIAESYALERGADPRSTGSLLATAAYAEQEFGLWRVAGGMSKLHDALLQRCRELGVHFESEQQEPNADVVVFDDQDALAADAAVGGFLVLVASSSRPELPTTENVFVPTSDADELECLFGPHPRPSQAPTIFVSGPNEPSESGTYAIRVMVPAPREDQFEWTDSTTAEQYAQHVLNQLAMRGVDLRPDALWIEWRTPRAPLSGSVRGGRFGRLALPNKRKHPGEYCVGGSAHPGGGIVEAAMSAEIVSELVRHDFPKRKKS